MNRPPISVLKVLLHYEARPLMSVRSEEFQSLGSAWVIYSKTELSPSMILTLHGYRTDRTNEMDCVVEEIKHYLHTHQQLVDVHEEHRNLRSEIIYYVEAVIRQKGSHITEREFKVHHPSDPIWAQLVVAPLSVPWYTPEMRIEGQKILHEEKIL